MDLRADPLSVEELIETSSGVFYSRRDFVAVDGSIVAFLKSQARRSRLRRARLCAHPDPACAQHDMLIVAERDGYIGPHRHPGKTESFLVVEGECEVLLFDPDGGVTDVLTMGPADAGRAFFYRMPEMRYHALIIRSEFLVFVESARGPFDPAQTEGAPWAPQDAAEGRRFLALASESYLGAKPGRVAPGRVGSEGSAQP